jgi:hypothetical protein
MRFVCLAFLHYSLMRSSERLGAGCREGDERVVRDGSFSIRYAFVEDTHRVAFVNLRTVKTSFCETTTAVIFDCSSKIDFTRGSISTSHPDWNWVTASRLRCLRAVETDLVHDKDGPEVVRLRTRGQSEAQKTVEFYFYHPAVDKRVPTFA